VNGWPFSEDLDCFFPIFVTFRTGWQDRPLAAVDLARRFEAAGADVLTLHPRVATDRRSRLPRWEYIEWVKKAVSMPVFGKGCRLVRWGERGDEYCQRTYQKMVVPPEPGRLRGRPKGGVLLKSAILQKPSMKMKRT